MAENIYSKGTRVWFEDKDHAWISAEVLSVTKGSDDTIKLVFVDERGKVLHSAFSPRVDADISIVRKSRLIPLAKKSRKERKACPLYATPLSLKRPTI